MIFYNGGFIIFGGSFGSFKRTSTIARFDETTRKWSKLGDLLTERSNHGVVYNRQSFLVLGGTDGDMKVMTEKCQINGEFLTCSYQPPTLVNFYHWPTPFLVDDTFNQ